MSGHKLLLLLGETEEDVFQLRDEHDVVQWMSQELPILLVVRQPDGIRWMELRDWLRRETDGGKKPIKQIPIEGERFDVMSVRRWRDRLLESGVTPAGG